MASWWICKKRARLLESTLPARTSITRWWNEPISTGARHRVPVRRPCIRELQPGLAAPAAGRPAELPLLPAHDRSALASFLLCRSAGGLGAPVQHHPRASAPESGGGVGGAGATAHPHAG